TPVVFSVVPVAPAAAAAAVVTSTGASLTATTGSRRRAPDRVQPVTEAARTRRRVYRIADNLLAFYLRALLGLVHPQHPDAPTVAHPAPRSLHVPRSEQRPLTIRLPSPGRAGMRATWLAAAMTAAG
ncbi:MAG: hypothetical protein LC799_14405, partial [Actinobacteria bacterium]|nr:hypothetical protein [Actinomycetota bacterium]